MKLLQLLEKVNMSFKLLLNLFNIGSFWKKFFVTNKDRFNLQLNSMPIRVGLTYAHK